MNCESFLPAMETGGFVQRILARCHAARCGRCAAVRAAFTATKQELAAAEPLSPRARESWERAAGEVNLQPSRRRVWLGAAAGLAVATCVLLVVLAVAFRPKSVAPQAENNAVVAFPQPPDREVIEDVSSDKELSHLVAAVDQLDAELQRLQRQAEKVAAQQQINAMLERFGRW
jgi:negative regulator of sigma E activity